MHKTKLVHFSFPFFSGLQQHLAAQSESERASWVCALSSASHGKMRQRMETLRDKLGQKMSEETATPSSSSSSGAALKHTSDSIVIGKLGAVTYVHLCTCSREQMTEVGQVLVAQAPILSLPRSCRTCVHPLRGVPGNARLH